MGYGDEMNVLREIQETAGQLYDWISGEREAFPPHSIIDAVGPRLNDIRTELMYYLTQFESRTPTERIDWTQAERLVDPDTPVDIMALNERHGLYIPVKPAYQRLAQNAELEAAFEPDAGGDISVAVYVDGADQVRMQRLIQRVDEFVQAMGYDGPIGVEIERGSIFRRSRAKAQQILKSEELRNRLGKLERGLELAGLELKQAQVDQGEAEAISRLLAEIREIPRACIRAGSILLAKFPTAHGPALVVRTLSQLEIRALEQFPEIQKNPERLLESLAAAVDGLEVASPQQNTDVGTVEP